MQLAQQFRKWLVDEVLPSLYNTGAYISPAVLPSTISVPPLLQIQDETPLDIDVSMYPEISVNSYDHLQILYLAYLKKYSALKFGLTDDLVTRIKQHCQKLGDKSGDVKLIRVFETVHKATIESSLKQCVLMNGWRRDDVKIDGSIQTEMIDLRKTTIENIIQIIEQFIQEHEKLLKEKEDAILGKSLEIEKFRLEKERETKHIEKEIEIKRIDLEAKRIDADLESKRLDIKKIEVQAKYQHKTRARSKEQKSNTILNYYSSK